MSLYEIIADDTIAAIATAQGEGGIAIVRLSGSLATTIAEGCFRPLRIGPLRPGRLRTGAIIGEDGAVLDEAVCVYMKTPRSYTREDVIELQCHGGRVSANRALNRALSLGARLAQPGEFTRRAFLNGRIDLSEAEAVMGIIHAGGEAAARAAVRQMEGGVSRFVRKQKEKLVELLSLIEASDDFPDEVEEQYAAEEVLRELKGILAEVDRAADSRQARIVREGLSVVLAGRPNVGKSSLMNALLNQERAIVSHAPGTTRDVLTERMRLNGLTLELTDTAGQRDTDDPVESIGVDRARRAEQQADIVLLVIDASEELTKEDEHRVRAADDRYLVVLNKMDIERPRVSEEQLKRLTRCPVLTVSALAGAGIDALYEQIGARSGAADLNEEQFTVQRHIECARAVKLSIERAIAAIEEKNPVDIASVDLWDAVEALSEITGENATEDVIDKVFASFCVGK